MQVPSMGTPDLIYGHGAHIWNQHGAHIRKTLVPLHDDTEVENCCERENPMLSFMCHVQLTL